MNTWAWKMVPSAIRSRVKKIVARRCEVLAALRAKKAILFQQKKVLLMRAPRPIVPLAEPVVTLAKKVLEQKVR